MPVEELSFIKPIRDGVIGSVGLKFHRNGLALATWTESWTVFSGEIFVNYTDFYAHRFSVALPSLKIGRSGNDSLVSWSALAEGYTLETASSLSAPTWTTVSNANGDRHNESRDVAEHQQAGVLPTQEMKARPESTKPCAMNE